MKDRNIHTIGFLCPLRCGWISLFMEWKPCGYIVYITNMGGQRGHSDAFSRMNAAQKGNSTINRKDDHSGNTLFLPERINCDWRVTQLSHFLRVRGGFSAIFRHHAVFHNTLSLHCRPRLLGGIVYTVPYRELQCEPLTEPHLIWLLFKLFISSLKYFNLSFFSLAEFKCGHRYSTEDCVTMQHKLFYLGSLLQLWLNMFIFIGYLKKEVPLYPSPNILLNGS